MTPPFPPPSSAISLYAGEVMHARLKPRTHRFAYRVYAILIDVDRLAEAGRRSRLFSVGRFNLLSFHPGDHGDGRTDLGAHVRRLLAAAGLAAEVRRVVLLCYPRVLGFVFNPISVYFAYDAADSLVGMVYEVRNTFGDLHAYVAPVADGELTEAGLRQTRDKIFHVSPFLGMNMRYLFRIRPPGDELALRILETDDLGPILSAIFHGRRRELTTASALRAFFATPLMTLKVVAGIHYEAMKLWFKGIRFFDRPPPPPQASAGGRFLAEPHGLSHATEGGRE